MIGLLFARPDLQLAQEQIIPSLEYYHHRSGDSIDFFCAGYSCYSHENDEIQPIKVGELWEFNPISFNQFRREIEDRSSWQYSGEVDLILLDGKCDDNGNTYLDFEYAWVCDLDNMIRNNAIENVHRFFEEIFRFAGDTGPLNGVREFAALERRRALSSGLVNTIISRLPGSFGSAILRYIMFIGRNLAPEEYR